MSKLDTIGKRAAWAIEEHRLQKHMKKCKAYAEIDVKVGTVSSWRKGITEPRGYHLQQMALAGYDVLWILLGGDSVGTS